MTLYGPILTPNGAFLRWLRVGILQSVNEYKKNDKILSSEGVNYIDVESI